LVDNQSTGTLDDALLPPAAWAAACSAGNIPSLGETAFGSAGTQPDKG